jgi:hypothetical protein
MKDALWVFMISPLYTMTVNLKIEERSLNSHRRWPETSRVAAGTLDESQRTKRPLPLRRLCGVFGRLRGPHPDFHLDPRAEPVND